MSPDKTIIGINPCVKGFNYHDPAACLIRGGKISFAIEEERFNRIKSSCGIFPTKSVLSCIERADQKNIDCLAIAYDPAEYLKRVELDAEVSDKESAHHRSQVFLNTQSAENEMHQFLPAALKNVPMKFYRHHLCHAASSYFHAQFDEATIVVIDGVGEFETTSIWHAKGGKIKEIKSYTMPNSIGYFYALMTDFIGFKPWEGEGKTMALAPYGQPENEFNEKILALIVRKDELFNISDFLKPLLREQLFADVDQCREYLASYLGVKHRTKESPIEQVHKDIAYAIQNALETCILKIFEYAGTFTGCYNFCFSGGVALNSKLNMKLREQAFVEKLYIYPPAGDAGIAIGAAILANEELGVKFIPENESLNLGLIGGNSPETTLKRYKISYSTPANLNEFLVERIEQQKIIMWVSGGCEFGPRSLGGRSILADPRSKQLAININTKVKGREPWRPFAPSILREHAHEVLEGFAEGDIAPGMIECYRIKESWILKIPGVMHEADYTTRPQTVSKRTHEKYHSLIQTFYQKTGIPLLLNTSLNGPGEPIVLTYEDALRFFFTSSADILVLDEYIIEK